MQLTHQVANHVGRAQARVRDGVLHAPLRCEQHDHRVVVELALLEDAPLTRQAEGDPLLDQLLQPAHKVEGREALLVLGLLAARLLSLLRLAHADQRAATRRQLGRLILKGVEELLELGVIAVLGVKDESTQLSVHAKLLGRRQERSLTRRWRWRRRWRRCSSPLLGRRHRLPHHLSNRRRCWRGCCRHASLSLQRLELRLHSLGLQPLQLRLEL